MVVRLTDETVGMRPSNEISEVRLLWEISEVRLLSRVPMSEVEEAITQV